MSNKEAFNDDEWFLLSSMPGLIGAAMSNAAPSGVISTIKEMSAIMRASAQGVKDYPQSELLAELFIKADNWDEAKEKLADYRERTQERIQSANISNQKELQAIALNDCQSAAQLVNERCTPEEAKLYKQWTLDVARTVAEAAKEGSILGFGGERISPPERELLQRIENALGIQSGVLLA